jgi:hypothetical protein
MLRRYPFCKLLASDSESEAGRSFIMSIEKTLVFARPFWTEWRKRARMDQVRSCQGCIKSCWVRHSAAMPPVIMIHVPSAFNNFNSLDIYWHIACIRVSSFFCFRLQMFEDWTAYRNRRTPSDSISFPLDCCIVSSEARSAVPWRRRCVPTI